MKKRMMLTALGKDHPGIVKTVSEVLYETRCNIEDSAMTQICGNFAMMLAVVIPDELSAKELEDRLKKLVEQKTLFIDLKPLQKPEKKKAIAREKRRCVLTVSGSDKPGIVYEVTRLLADRNINIATINTRIFTDNGNDTYIMILELELPDEIQFSRLKFELSGVSEKLDVEITLEPIITEHI